VRSSEVRILVVVSLVLKKKKECERCIILGFWIHNCTLIAVVNFGLSQILRVQFAFKLNLAQIVFEF
jgi:hypothetical protein